MAGLDQRWEAPPLAPVGVGIGGAVGSSSQTGPWMGPWMGPVLAMSPESAIPRSPVGLSRANPETMTDADWVRRSLKGDPRSFQHLYQRYAPKVRSTLYQLCGTEGLDDLVQETFLRAWKGLPRFRHNASFSTWLYRIAWNVASDRRRDLAKVRSQRQQQQRLDPDPATDSPALSHLHYQDVVERALASLDLEHRAVAVLCDLDDLPQKEVAQVLGIPVGTVKSRLFHARAQLRTFLEQQGIQP